MKLMMGFHITLKEVDEIEDQLIEWVRGYERYTHALIANCRISENSQTGITISIMQSVSQLAL